VTSLQLEVEVCWLRSLGRLRRRAECFLGHTLVFSHQTDVAPQFAVSKGSYGNKANGHEQRASPEPREAVMPLGLGGGSAGDGAGQANEKQRDQEAHHQSVTAL